MDRSNASGGNLGRNLRQVGRARVSWVVVLVLLGIQLAVELHGGFREVSWWYHTFGLTRAGVTEGKVWQLVTHALLHGGWIHVGLNSLCLLLIGSRIEQMLGGRVLLKLCLFAVVAGGIAHVSLAAGAQALSPLVGASAACVGLLLLLTTLSPESRMWPLPVSARNLGLGILAGEGLLALMTPDLGVPGLSGIGRVASASGLDSWWSIGHACHAGGGLAGWLYGRWILRPRLHLHHLRRDRARREAKKHR